MIQVEIRVIAATHRDPPQAVTIGPCRKALCFRFHVIPLTRPPLRGDLEDTP
jgi:transcriptional regulator with GAF, ATPase, and Fis domain